MRLPDMTHVFEQEYHCFHSLIELPHMAHVFERESFVESLASFGSCQFSRASNIVEFAYCYSQSFAVFPLEPLSTVSGSPCFVYPIFDTRMISPCTSFFSMVYSSSTRVVHPKPKGYHRVQLQIPKFQRCRIVLAFWACRRVHLDRVEVVHRNGSLAPWPLWFDRRTFQEGKANTCKYEVDLFFWKDDSEWVSWPKSSSVSPDKSCSSI
jgi:hypothetical protein